MTTVAVQRQAQRRRSPLIGYLLRRAGTSLLLLVGVTIVTFALTNLVPGDPVSAALGEGASQNPATRDAFIKEHGLDQPLFVQYFIYMGNLLRGDLPSPAGGRDDRDVRAHQPGAGRPRLGGAR